jgi:molecular chaperone HscA
MLMQIAEPGESHVKQACKLRVVGIDLGTTNSLIAHVADLTPEVIGGDGGPLVPSVVHYGKDGSVLVGRPAQARALDAPRDTLASVKRLIGRGAKDLASVRAMLPYELAGDDRAITVRVSGARGDRLVSPIEVSAEILRELKARAERSLGGPVDGAVITVPAYFDDAQRQATRDAGRLAGLEVLRLVAEPTAAAVAYGLDRGAAGTYAVFDLGGGTFDVSILKLVDGVFEVKATGGDAALGGDDLDRLIALAMVPCLTDLDRRTIGAAVAEARRVKEALSDLPAEHAGRGGEPGSAGGLGAAGPGHGPNRPGHHGPPASPEPLKVRFELTIAGELPRARGGDGIVHDALGPRGAGFATRCDVGTVIGLATSDATSCMTCLARGDRFAHDLTADELAAIARPFLERTRKPCLRALKDAELTVDELDGVILVGGSTRAPVVRRHVREVFQREPLFDLDPEQVVALGAAVQADVLAGGRRDVTLLDVVPLSLGVEMMGGVVEKLIHRNTTIPTGATQTFTTYADNQTGFDIHILQGERETADACRSLARFVLRGVPPMIAGMARVEITFLIDADGLLKVMAKELTTGQEASIEVRPSYGLSDEEVEQMLIDSFEHAEDDLARRNLAIERVEADRILAATRAAFISDAALLDPEVRLAGEAAMRALEAAMAGDDHRAVRDRIAALDVATKPFAQLRMNRAVAAQLHGVSLDDAARKVGA